MSMFVDDGYTRRGFIAAVKGQHPALEFRYRPLMAEERDSLYAATERAPPVEQIRMIATAISDRLESWSTRDKKGNVMEVGREINADTVRRLQPALFNKLYNIVNGSRSTDAFPDGTMPDEEEDYRDAMEGAGNGKSVGQAREERLEKNSVAPSA